MIDVVFPTVKLKWEILSCNNKRKDRKIGKFSLAWLGPYVVPEMTPKGVTTFKKQNGEILKVKYYFSELKLNGEEKTVDTGGDTTQLPS